jgi:hypothetical protein
MLANCFESVTTIEAQPFLYESAQLLYRSAKLENVTARLGNSADVLGGLEFNAHPDSIAFFLDAHYSFGPTSQAFGICPLIAELTLLFKRFTGATIVIDDIRCMNGQNGYPTIDQILDIVPQSYVAVVQYDQLMLSRATL